MAAIPMYFSQVSKQKAAHPAVPQTTPSSPDSPSAESSPDNSANSSTANSPAAKPKMNFFTAIGELALLGLGSPFLELQDPFHGAIGLVILFVGMRFAWQQTSAPKLEIMGPFQNRAPTAAAT